MKGVKYQMMARLVFGAVVSGNLLGMPLVSRAATYSYTDLNPSGFTYSAGYGTSGSQQVGWGDGHALLWSGTASSVVDLHPSGFTYSAGYGTSGGQQVGAGTGLGGDHALL